MASDICLPKPFRGDNSVKSEFFLYQNGKYTIHRNDQDTLLEAFSMESQLQCWLVPKEVIADTCHGFVNTTIFPEYPSDTLLTP